MKGFRWRYALPLIAIIILGIMLILDWKYKVFINVLPGFDISEAVLFVLVVITFGYAISTDRMAGHMRQQQFNAVAPVIELTASKGGITPGEESNIRVGFCNIGAGPALNFRCWLEHEQYPDLRTANRCISRCAIGLGNDGVDDTIYTGIDGYELGQGYLRAQYEDVFGQTYESCLIISENALPELKYGRAKEKIII